jgi:hypothetical protein
VLARVGERLLNDAVGREVEHRWHRSPRAHRRGGQLEARRARLVQQAVERVEPGGGPVGRRLAGVPQDPHQRAELGEHGLARVLHVLERGARRVRLRVQQPARDGRLHADDGDVVPDDVVQLARDPEPLLGHAPARLHLARRLGALRAIPYRLDRGAPGARGQCERDCDHVHGGDEPDDGGRLLGAVSRGAHRDERALERGDRERRPAAPPRDGGVDGDQRAEERAGARAGQEGAEAHRDPRRDQRHRRSRAAT